MRNNCSILLTLAIVIAFSIITVPQSVAAQVAGPKYGGTMVLGFSSETRGLAPPVADNQGSEMVYKVLEPLISRDTNGVLRPRLAMSWDFPDDAMSLTLHLFPNVTWHDGTPFTSDDVKFSIEQILVPSFSGFGVWRDKIQSITTPDKHTVVMKFKVPCPYATVSLDEYSCQILPKHLYDGTDAKTNPYNMKPIGTGPFKFLEWKKGEYIRYVRNPNYHMKGLPYLDEVVIRFYPDASALTTALEKKEVHAVPLYFPLNEVSRLKNNPQLDMSVWPQMTGALELLCINLQHADPIKNKILNNLNVRKAMAHAINKQIINEKGYYGLAEVADSIFGPGAFTGWWVNQNVPKYPYDPKKANNLLDEAGYPKGSNGIRFRLEVLNDNFRTEQQKYCELIRDMFLDVGIGLDIKTVDDATWIDISWVRSPKMWDLAWLPFRGGGPDPAYMDMYYAGKGIVNRAWTNAMGYNNPRVNELFEKGTATANQQQRKVYYDEIQALIMADLPVIPVITKPRCTPYWKDFHNVVSRITMGGSTGEMESVWWDGGKTPTGTSSTRSTTVTAPAVSSDIYIGVVIAAVAAIAGMFYYQRSRKKRA